MSTAATAVPPVARTRRFTLARAAARVELAKLTGQVGVRVALAVCLLAPLGFAVIMTIQSAVPADTLFGRWAKTSGFAAALTVLGFAGSFGLPLLAGVVGGDLFASEDRHGTWKTVLTRSCTRADVFVAKAVAAAVYALAAVGALALGSLAGGLSLLGSAPFVGLSGQLVPPGRAAGLVLAGWAYALLPTLAFVALALLLSIVTRSGIVGVLGPAVAGLVLQLVSLAGSGEIARALLPATPFDAWHGLFTTPVHYRPLLQGALTSAVYTAVFLAAGWQVLRRRSFPAAEHRAIRRTSPPLRTAVALAALLAVLLVAGGWGPTADTHQRLEASITPTFERLVQVQYRWRTHLAFHGRAVSVRTSCQRAGGRRQGPGDDWTCIVVPVNPQTQGASLPLDVTVRPNGCFTADAPPSLVGPPLIRDVRGRLFVNPLATFDGCLGTA